VNFPGPTRHPSSCEPKSTIPAKATATFTNVKYSHPGLRYTATMIDRRRFLANAALGVTAGAAVLALRPAVAASAKRITKPIPKSGERIGVIGMGSWITFNVGGDATLRAARTKVLDAFFAAGGGMIDSSPMYGSSEEVIGHCLDVVRPEGGLFSATKVWTSSKTEGVEQFQDSLKLWGLSKLDLYQIHNLVGWRDHLETMLELKVAGRIRYIGITTSHGRRHRDLEEIIKTRPEFDFLQLTYNPDDREVETRLLPAASANGVAVIVNRPFQRGYLIERLAKKPLPGWAAEIGCSGWPQVLLKYAVSHPAVTCAIPATSQVPHMVENMAAGTGQLPDAELRRRVAAFVQDL
jgi:diketogulonate reductase-like aldo/keto reductase